MRRLEVSAGQLLRVLVLIDDHTGAVALRRNLVDQLDRSVCDWANKRTALTCTGGFARTEHGPASGIRDADTAFDVIGSQADLFAADAPAAFADLTQVVGQDIGSTRTILASTRYCTDDWTYEVIDGRPTPKTWGSACPLDNAYWNGLQLFLGDGFAAADDVVAHEVMHGYTQHVTDEAFFDENGAIDESMSDIFGEIVDHRRGTDDDSAWLIGEDVPTTGAIRNLKNPAEQGDPDSTFSPHYKVGDLDVDPHAMAGIGNKTAYLISQGSGSGTFRGNSVIGIDGTDHGLNKTAILYLEALPRLTGIVDWLDLGRALRQSCQDLAARGTVHGQVFTEADCASVDAATEATGLMQVPATQATWLVGGRGEALAGVHFEPIIGRLKDAKVQARQHGTSRIYSAWTSADHFDVPLVGLRSTRVWVDVRTLRSDGTPSAWKTLVIDRGLVGATARRRGARIVFTGSVTRPDGRRTVAGDRVRIERRVGDTWKLVRRVPINPSTGRFRGVVVRAATASYRVRYLGVYTDIVVSRTRVIRR